MRIHGNPKGVFDPKGLGEGVFGGGFFNTRKGHFQYKISLYIIQYHIISFSVTKISYYIISIA